MSLRDRGLEPYRGPRLPASSRWLVILRRCLREQLGQRAVRRSLFVLALLLVGWSFAMLSGRAGSFVVQRMGGPQGAAPTIGFAPESVVFHYLTSFAGGLLVAVLVGVTAGAGVIADDVRTGALPFYLSRPVTLDSYLLAKVLSVTLLCFGVLFGGAALLVAENAALARASELPADALLLGRAAAMALVESALIAVPVAALSAAIPRRERVRAAMAAWILLPWMIGGVASRITRAPWARLASVISQIDSLGALTFGRPADEAARTLPAWAAGAAAVLIVAGSVVWLRGRLARLEEGLS